MAADIPVLSVSEEKLQSMSIDEQIDLAPLVWLGCGDATLDDWRELRGKAARVHNNRTASYLLGMTLLADYLEEAFAQFGMSCAE